MKHIFFTAAAIASCLFFSACKETAVTLPENEVVVLFTSDVHCKVDGNLSFPHVAALKADLKKQTPNVILADLGDATQGEPLAIVSKGMNIIEIMNETGYDLCTIGNHEFDYGLTNFGKLVKASKARYLNSNIHYTGTNVDQLENTLPYYIQQFGNIKIAFLGITTPLSYKSSTPEFFKENGKIVYDLCEGKSGSKLYSKIQSLVNQARSEGADYVIALSHLGISTNSEIESQFSSIALINHTKGINAVIDAHNHTTAESHEVYNLEGKKIPLAGCSEFFTSIGKLTLKTDGTFTSELISSYDRKDEKVEKTLVDMISHLKQDLDSVIARTSVALNIKDDKCVRIVRTRETTIGNFCADAYRAVTQADIGFANAGGIRTSLAAGDITYENIISLNPFGNQICCKRVKGQQILDALEFGAKNTMKVSEKEGKAAGEFGGFLTVSGLKYTIDLSYPSPVQLDSKGMLEDIHGYRRIKDVKVLKNGKYVNLDPKGWYTIAGQDYLLKNNGDGNTAFNDGEMLMDNVMIDHQALIFYITDILEGNLDSLYGKTEGRITIE